MDKRSDPALSQAKGSGIPVEQIETRWLIAAYLALCLAEFVGGLLLDFSNLYLFSLSEVLIVGWLFWNWRGTDLDLEDVVVGPVKLSRRGVQEALGLTGILLVFSTGFGLLFWAALVHVAPELGFTIFEQFRDYRSVLIGKDLVTNVIRAASVIAIGPVLEEVLFRGVLLRRWAWKYGTLRGLLLSSMLFGALHWFNFFGAFISGAVWGLLYLRTQNLWAPILAHAVFNGAVVGKELIPGGAFYGLPVSADAMVWWWWLGSLAMLTSVPLLILTFVRNAPLLSGHVHERRAGLDRLRPAHNKRLAPARPAAAPENPPRPR